MWNDLETAGYVFDFATVPAFMQNEGLIPGKDHKIPLKELYARYNEYCIEADRLAEEERDFSAKLRLDGYTVERGNGGYYYVHCGKTE